MIRQLLQCGYNSYRINDTKIKENRTVRFLQVNFWNNWFVLLLVKRHEDYDDYSFSDFFRFPWHFPDFSGFCRWTSGWIGLSSVLRTRQRSICYIGDPYKRPNQTVSKYWRKKLQRKIQKKQKKQNTHINTKYTLRSLNGGGTTDAVPSVNEWYWRLPWSSSASSLQRCRRRPEP